MSGSLAETSHLSTAVLDRGVLATTEVVARVHRIQEVMKTLMKVDTHFGTIPGTPKPTLYKPGAELLLMTFRIAASPSLIEDLSTPDEIRYRVTVRGTNQVSGEIVGEMSGECSSNEEKYRWRKPVCQEEFDETPMDRRREKWSKGWGDKPPYKQPQVRTSPADVANTILKMATKRALVAMTLVALGASDIFAQDLEDLSDELRDSISGSQEPPEKKKTAQAPQRRSQSGAKKPADGEQQHTVPVLIAKVGKPDGKQFFRIEVSGDQRYFTAWPGQHDDAIVAATKFAGEPTKVIVTFTEKKAGDKSYFNVVAVAAAPVDEPTATPGDREPGSDDGDVPKLTAADIFGDKK